jgi:hypothetical protein
MRFIIAFADPSPSARVESTDYELIDLRVVRDMHTFGLPSKRQEAVNELTAFVRIITFSLLRNRLFKRFKRLDEMPHEYFSGRDKLRLCSSIDVMSKFVEEMLTADQLLSTESFDAVQFVASVQYITRHGSMPDDPTLSINCSTGSGQVAALVLLGRHQLTPQLLRRDLDVVQHLMLRSSITELEHVTAAMSQVNTAAAQLTFLVMFECCIDENRPDLLASTIDGKPTPSVRFMTCNSFSICSGRFFPDKDGRCVGFDVRATIDPVSLTRKQRNCSTEQLRSARALANLTVRVEPSEFDRAGVLFVVIPSMVSPGSWEVLKIPAFKQMMHSTATGSDEPLAAHSLDSSEELHSQCSSTDNPAFVDESAIAQNRSLGGSDCESHEYGRSLEGSDSHWDTSHHAPAESDSQSDESFCVISGSCELQWSPPNGCNYQAAYVSSETSTFSESSQNNGCECSIMMPPASSLPLDVFAECNNWMHSTFTEELHHNNMNATGAAEATPLGGASQLRSDRCLDLVTQDQNWSYIDPFEGTTQAQPSTTITDHTWEPQTQCWSVACTMPTQPLYGVL